MRDYLCIICALGNSEYETFFSPCSLKIDLHRKCKYKIPVRVKRFSSDLLKQKIESIINHTNFYSLKIKNAGFRIKGEKGQVQSQWLVYLSIYLSIYLSVHIESIYLSKCIYLSEVDIENSSLEPNNIRKIVCLSICLSVYLCIYSHHITLQFVYQL